MLTTCLKISCAAALLGVLTAQTGCACGPAKGSCVTTVKAPCEPRAVCDIPSGEVSAALPPNARPGECYAKVYIPPQFKSVTERVLVREASEQIEIIPARYDWVEEKVLVKDSSTQLEVIPAEFATRERTIETESSHTDWEVNNDPLCVNPKGEPARDVFCLVTHPSARRTIQVQAQVRAASVREVCIPAQYETVRRQKLVSAATTRKVCIPAEYENVEKTVKVCDGRMAWKRVVCDRPEAERVSTHSDGSTRMILTADAKQQTKQP